MSKIQSAERVSQLDQSDNYVYQRSLLAYHKAAEIVSGDVLEIGTGSGYGVSIISPKVRSFVTIDKFKCPVEYAEYSNVECIRMNVPPLKDIALDSFDYVIMFQVIEHIKDDFLMMEEIHRVLRVGGKLIVSTPNKIMSLTRNPWHVREYTPDGFINLTQTYFRKVDAMGVFGDEKVMQYYRKNEQSVKKMLRFDIFGFEKWLPRKLLQIPYDILNRINRRKLLEYNRKLTSGITMDDYSIKAVDDKCFDLFYIAQK